MANVKITDLTAYTDPLNTDVLPIVDVTNNVTKKVSIANMAKNVSLGTAALPGVAFDGDPNTGIYSPGADQLAIATGGTGRITVDGSGNVNIDSGRLLVGTSTARSNFFNTTLAAGIQVEGTGASTARGALSVVNNDSSNNPALLILGRSRTASLSSNTVVADGDWIGTLSFQGADGTEFVEAASVTAYVDGTPGANDMPGRLVFSTTADGASSPTERMRITSAGRVNVISTEAGIISETTQGSGTTYVTFQGRYGATSGAPFSGVASFQVYSNGNVQNSNNSYGSISDIKLKENIVDANSQWDDLKALQVRNYNFKEGQTHTQIGLVAQEVELVSPGLVTESPDRDEEGNDLGTVTKSIKYSVLYTKAVKALQEAMERIETLEARLSALEGA